MTIRAQTGPAAQTGRRQHERPLASRQLAALCSALLLIDDAKRYGLIDGGPEVDRGRCEELLSKLDSEGIVPRSEETEKAVLGLLAELGAVRG